MIILGIDPALVHTGWAVIEHKNNKIFYISSGVIKPKINSQIHLRLFNLNKSIKNIIEKYDPNIVAVEESIVNLNAASSLKLGYARGAILASIGEFPKISFYEFKPNTIKKTVSGSGHATKEKILQTVKLIITEAKDIKDFNEADALAIAYTATTQAAINKI